MKLYNFGIDYDYVIRLLENYKDRENISWKKLGDKMTFSNETLKSWRNKTRNPNLSNLLTMLDHLKNSRYKDYSRLTIDNCLYERREIIDEIDKYNYDVLDCEISKADDEIKNKFRKLIWEDILYLVQKKLFFVLYPREERSLSNYISYYCCYSNRALKEFNLTSRVIKYNDFMNYLKSELPLEFPMEISDEEKLRILSKFEDYVILTTGEKGKYDYYDVFVEE